MRETTPVRNLKSTISDHKTLLRQLHAALPTSPTTDEERARASLAPLIAVAIASTVGTPIPADPAACPNCGQAATSERSPYCCEECRAEAAFVRQFRNALVDEAALSEDRQAALGQVMWHLLGGGYPSRQGLVPPKTLQQVIAKAGGLCACGAPATTIDHARTACNRPINLRAVCEDCNADRPFGDPAVTARPEFQRRLAELASRIGSDEPIRCCDDPAAWNWREFVAMRKALAR